MNKTIMFGIIAIGISILFSNLSNNAIAQNHATMGLHEDQALICILDTVSEKKGDEICKVVQILDMLTETQQRQLNNEFSENNDVFPIEALD